MYFFKMSKFDLFWTDLELDFDFLTTKKFTGILTASFEFYVEIGL